MSGLMPGVYTLTITGPSGVLLQLQTRIEERGRFELLLDDARLQEALVLLSMPTGIVEAELHALHQKGGAA